MISTIPVTVGAAIRRPFRRMLDRKGISYTEDKGFLDSQFILRPVSSEQHADLLAWVRAIENVR